MRGPIIIFYCLLVDLQRPGPWARLPELPGLPELPDPTFTSRTSAFPKEIHTRLELFLALVSKLLPGGFWRFIWSYSGLWWRSGFQMASGGSFGAILGSGGEMSSRWPLEAHLELLFGAILGSGGEMASRWSLEVHLELFWALVAKLLPGGLWRLIWSYSGLWWRNGFQMASGGSFGAILGSGGEMASRWPLEVHLELFWALVAKLLPDGLWRIFWIYSGLWWRNAFQMASGGSFGAILGSGGEIASRWPLEAHLELCGA